MSLFTFTRKTSNIMKLLDRWLATTTSYCILAALVLTLVAPTQHAVAQTNKWLAVGDHAHRYAETGSFGLAGVGNVWPFLQGHTGRVYAYHDGFELWLGAKNWTDPEGKTWDYKVSYTSHGELESSNIRRSVFPQTFKTISKYPEPEVVVNGEESWRVPADVDEVNPNLKADRMILLEANTNLGVKLTKRIYAFSQEDHQDYHIIEHVLTNTGNVDGDDEIELPDQTVEGLYLWHDRRWGQTMRTTHVVGSRARVGKRNMHDFIYDGGLRANYTWLGRYPGFDQWDPIGAPAVNTDGWAFPSGQDTTGRLHAIGFAFTSAIHAPKSTSDRSDDINQPSTMYYHDANAAQASGTDEMDPVQMADHYDWFSYGVRDPFQAYNVEPSGNFAHQSSTQYPSSAGVRVSQGYGPYTLEPGDSVRIVLAEGVTGIPYDAALEIGRKYKRLWEKGNDYEDIAYDADADGTIQEDERMDKNEWSILAPRDSVFKMARRAKANYEADFEIPQPPPPPTRFDVESAPGGVNMSWEYPHENPPGGFEIYRTSNFFEGTVENDYEYELVAEVSGDTRSFKDTTDVFRGVEYYYYLTALGEKNEDPTGDTPTDTRLESSRYYTQTYAPVTSLREPGQKLSQVRVVPNPFHVGASTDVRYAGAERIGFLDVPGQCTIRIFTERGDVVRVIEHTDGTGDEFWDLQTEAQQMVDSGLYIAVVEDHDTGERTIEKFVIVR
jgi:hypothetical protein